MLARTAARDTSLLALLADDARVSEAARTLRGKVLLAAGMEPPEPEEAPAPVVPTTPTFSSSAQVVPRSVVSRQMANPFLAPDFEAAAQRAAPRARRLSGWELLEPLFRSFEVAATGAPACMPLPDPRPVPVPRGRDVMPHQAQVITAAARGHRTFLLADEPGLGKTAQALLAAQAADAYPLLVVVPNVVKANWAHEVALWTPSRRATVVHGDGDQMDGFADVVIVNYELLDRHIGWLGDLGFRGMVVDEAHLIKNKTSQRSQHVRALSDRIRTRVTRPLLMALTGTPLINDIEDFRAIWQFLGWIDDTVPLGALEASLEETGLTPADPGFASAARSSVIDMGIVRRRKIDVVADIPARRVADLPVELDGAAGRSIRAAEAALTDRLVQRYRAALEMRTGSTALDEVGLDGIDHELVRRVAAAELKDSTSKAGGENVFTMVRRIGQAKAGPAADYAAQLARSVGKVVFFAKHVDVMDQAEQLFADRGIRLRVDPWGPDAEGAGEEHHRLRRGPRGAGRGVLPHRRWRGPQPPGGLEPRAGGAVVDLRRADAGHRPHPPHRPGRARHGVEDHRRADGRLEDRRAHRQQVRARGPRARRRGRGRPHVVDQRAARHPRRAAHRRAAPGPRGLSRAPRGVAGSVRGPGDDRARGACQRVELESMSASSISSALCRPRRRAEEPGVLVAPA